MNTEQKSKFLHGRVERLKKIMDKSITESQEINTKKELKLDQLRLRTFEQFNAVRDELTTFPEIKPKRTTFFDHIKKSVRKRKKSTPDEPVVEKQEKRVKKKERKPKKPNIVRMSSSETMVMSADMLFIDDFNSAKRKNNLGNRSNTYQMAPSSAIIDFMTGTIEGSTSGILRIDYNKKSKEGPHWQGGWCGYYSILKDDATNKYLDASGYNYISLWIKGKTGKENFAIGLADRRWDELGDSVKSNQIKAYIKNSKLTSTWQKVRIPLDEFSIDRQQLASIAICFESFCFPNGGGRGSVFIDNLALEK